MYFWVGGQRKYWLLSQRGTPAKFGGAPRTAQNFVAHNNDYTLTPCLHIPLPKHEASLVESFGGQLIPLSTLLRRPCFFVEQVYS